MKRRDFFKLLSVSPIALMLPVKKKVDGGIVKDTNSIIIPEGEVYVSKKGNDKNDGSIGKPVLTINNAMKKGNNITILDYGEYNEKLDIGKSISIVAIRRHTPYVSTNITLLGKVLKNIDTTGFPKR